MWSADQTLEVSCFMEHLVLHDIATVSKIRFFYSLAIYVSVLTNTTSYFFMVIFPVLESDIPVRWKLRGKSCE